MEHHGKLIWNFFSRKTYFISLDQGLEVSVTLFLSCCPAKIDKGMILMKFLLLMRFRLWISKKAPNELSTIRFSSFVAPRKLSLFFAMYKKICQLPNDNGKPNKCHELVYCIEAPIVHNTIAWRKTGEQLKMMEMYSGKFPNVITHSFPSSCSTRAPSRTTQHYRREEKDNCELGSDPYPAEKCMCTLLDGETLFVIPSRRYEKSTRLNGSPGFGRVPVSNFICNFNFFSNSLYISPISLCVMSLSFTVHRSRIIIPF